MRRGDMQSEEDEPPVRDIDKRPELERLRENLGEPEDTGLSISPPAPAVANSSFTSTTAAAAETDNFVGIAAAAAAAASASFFSSSCLLS